MTSDGAARRIHPLARPPEAVVGIPGSKSLTNRALILAALARGHSRLTNALFADDTIVMVDALGRLGFAVEVDEAALEMRVEGHGGDLPAPSADLYVGGAGTAARFLTAMVTLGSGRYRLDGSTRMRERPIGELVAALNALGASVTTTRESLPLVVEARGLRGGCAVVRGDVSSQFVSAVLMAAPYAATDVEVLVEGRLVGGPYVAMTVAAMAAFGVEVQAEGLRRFRVRAGQRYRPRDYAIEPDASGAAYFFAAAAITGGRVRVPGLSSDSLQGDVRFVDILERMGCRVERAPDSIAVAGPGATGGVLDGIDVDLAAMSDQTMTLAAIAPFAAGPTRIRGIGHIRYQESDRLAATAAELRRLGQEVEEFDDGLLIVPRPVTPAVVRTYDDHRLAMAFAVMGLRAPGIAIADPGCVAKTFPDFFERLDRLRTGG